MTLLSCYSGNEHSCLRVQTWKFQRRRILEASFHPRHSKGEGGGGTKALFLEMWFETFTRPCHVVVWKSKFVNVLRTYVKTRVEWWDHNNYSIVHPVMSLRCISAVERGLRWLWQGSSRCWDGHPTRLPPGRWLHCLAFGLPSPLLPLLQHRLSSATVAFGLHSLLFAFLPLGNCFCVKCFSSISIMPVLALLKEGWLLVGHVTGRYF